MAMDWIKMRCNLWDDPKVGGLVEATDTNEATVIGGLYWLWATADQHTADGAMPSVSLKHIDRKTGIAGFGAALVAIGWVLVGEGGGLSVGRFEEHNGASGKQRSMAAKRVAKHRATQVSGIGNGSTVTKMAHDRELEQEQEQEQDIKAKATPQQAAECVPEKPSKGNRKPHTAARFPEFWAAYPVKKSKQDALRHWKAKRCDEFADDIIAHVRLMEAQDSNWQRGFIPYGGTYVCGEHWTDEPQKDKDQVHVTAAVPPPETFGAKAALARTESKLDNAIGYIRQQYANGMYGSGEEAKAKALELIEEAKRKHGGADGKE